MAGSFQTDPWGAQPAPLGSGIAGFMPGDDVLRPAGDVFGGGMDPITAATWINAGSNVLGKALAPSSAGPSRADSSLWQQNTFDNSGWTVATGGSTAQGGARGLDLPPWMILGAVALVVVVWAKKNK